MPCFSECPSVLFIIQSPVLPEGHGGDLREVHGCDARVEARVDADDEAAEDEEVVRVGVLGRHQAHAARSHQDVVQEQPALGK